MPPIWVERQQQLPPLIRAYLDNPLLSIPLDHDYSDLYLQKGAFSPAALLRSKGIRRAIKICDQLFQVYCLGFHFFVDRHNKIIFRVLRSRALQGPHEVEKAREPPVMSRDLSKICIAREALRYLYAVFQFVDYALPIICREENRPVLDSDSINEIKKKWIQYFSSFACAIDPFDHDPEIEEHLRAFCQKLIHELADMSNRESRGIEQSLIIILRLAPLGDQVYDEVSFDESTGIGTTDLVMSGPELQQLVEFALVILDQELPLDARDRSEHLLMQIHAKIFGSSEGRAQEEIFREQEEILKILEEKDLRPPFHHLSDLLPSWYKENNKTDRALFLPLVRFLFTQNRWLVPSDYPTSVHLPVLPAGHYFLRQSWHYDLSLRVWTDLLVHTYSGPLTRYSLFDQRRAQSAFNVWAAARDAACYRIGAATLAIRTLDVPKGLDEQSVASVRRAVLGYNISLRERGVPLTLPGNRPEQSVRIHHSCLKLGCERTPYFGQAQFPLWWGIEIFAKECLAETSMVSQLVKTICVFLTWRQSDDFAEEEFRKFRQDYDRAVLALHQLKTNYREKERPCLTREQIWFLEAIMAFYIVFINDYYLRKHPWRKFFTGGLDCLGFLGYSGQEYFLRTVPVPSVLEFIPEEARGEGVRYSGILVALEAIVTFFSGAFAAEEILPPDAPQADKQRLQSILTPRFNRLSGKDQDELHYVRFLEHFFVSYYQDKWQDFMKGQFNKFFSIIPGFSRYFEPNWGCILREFLDFQQKMADLLRGASCASGRGGGGWCPRILPIISRAVPFARSLVTEVARIRDALVQPGWVADHPVEVMSVFALVSSFREAFLKLTELRYRAHFTLTAEIIYQEVLLMIATNPGENFAMKRQAIFLVCRAVRHKLDEAEQRKLTDCANDLEDRVQTMIPIVTFPRNQLDSFLFASFQTNLLQFQGEVVEP